MEQSKYFNQSKEFFSWNFSPYIFFVPVQIENKFLSRIFYLKLAHMYDDLMVIPELQKGTYILKAMQNNIVSGHTF